MEPGTELRPAIKTMQISCCLQENNLSQVICIMVVEHHAIDHGSGLTHVPLHQCLKVALILGPIKRRYKLLIRHVTPHRFACYTP